MNLSYRRAARFVFAVFLGLAAGVATAVGILLAGTAVFWLFLFGDDPWPSYAETILVIAAYVAGALVFVGVTWLANRSR